MGLELPDLDCVIVQRISEEFLAFAIELCVFDEEVEGEESGLIQNDCLLTYVENIK